MYLVPVSTKKVPTAILFDNGSARIVEGRTVTEYEAFDNLVDATSRAGDGLVLHVVAPDGLDHAKNCLQVLQYVKENPGCTRSRLCRAMGKRFSRATLDTLVGLGYIIENKERIGDSKKPTRTYRATKIGAHVVSGR